MAKKNTNFRLGLDRKRLIEATIYYGKSEKTAKKENTRRLEQYLMNRIAIKGTPFPELSAADKRDIRDNAEAWGTMDALKRLTYRVEKLTGTRDEENFLRLTMRDNFSLFYNGTITREHIDELISRLPRLAATQVDSDMINISPWYRQLYLDYADELKETERKIV